MKLRMQEWLKETHGVRFELLRHFLPRLFDSELVSAGGDWLRIVGGVFALLVSSWMILANLLLFKYNELARANRWDRFAIEVQADQTALSCLAACLTVLLAALLWQSLYPTLRDYLALAGWPVRSSEIFTAKFSAVLLVFAAFLLTLVAPSSFAFGVFTRASIPFTFLMMAAACSTAFFGLLAIQGLLLNLLPSAWFERVLIGMQALLASLAIGGFSWVAMKGEAIAGGVQLTTPRLLVALFVPPLAAGFFYVLSFHRFKKVLLEAPPVRSSHHLDILSWLLSFFVREPREQAAFAFFWRTVQRSRIHRLAVLVYLGLAGAWILKSLIDLNHQSAALQREIEKMMFTTGPLALMVLTFYGLRHLFSLPADLRAVWVFQITEREGRSAWLRAVERFVVCAIAPVLAIGAFFVSRVGGVLTAAGWLVIAGLLAAVMFEVMFRDWRKLPFTCSYLPGKRPLIMNCILLVSLLPLLLPVAYFIYQGATNPASFLILVSLEAAAWTWFHRGRMREWALVPLRFEELPPSEVDSFGLSQEGTVIAQEQFAREWTDYVRSGPDDPIVRPLEPGETRTERIWEWLRATPRDLRHAVRLMLRNPVFSLSTIVTLGLGLGLNAAFFTMFNAFLLRPLAVRDPASLMTVQFTARNNRPVHMSWQDYRSLAANSEVFSEMAASSMEGTGLDGQSSKVAMVSSNFFSLLGAGIALGRPFQPGESNPVMVLSNRLWQNRFGSDPDIVGRKLNVGGVPFEVIGVAAPEFVGVNAGTVAIAPPEIARYGIIAADYWVPIEVWQQLPQVPKYPVYGIVGRLPRSMNSAQAEAMLTSYARRTTSEREYYNRIHRATLESLDIPITWTALRYSLPLLIAFALTMLIPCANAANLMLARALSRQRELGTRLSLGATRGRIVRQQLTESLLLAVFAAGTGLLIASLALRTISKTIYATAPATLLSRFRIPDLVIDGHVYFYMLMVAVLTTVLFALAPAAQASRLALNFSVRGELGSHSSFRMRDALVIAQVSLCAMLLVIAGVMLRGTRKAITIERGYEARGVYGVGNESTEDGLMLSTVLARESWVDTVAFARPLNGMDLLQASNPAKAAWVDAWFQVCSGDLPRLVNIPLMRGRTFTRDEEARSAPVAVISEMAARRLFPNEDALGKTIAIQPSQSMTSQRRPQLQSALVVGIIRDFVSKVRDGGPRPVVLFPSTLRPGIVVMVKGKGAPDQTAKLLEVVLHRTAAALHGARIIALQETLDWETYPQQAVSWLSGILGVVALLLTVTGIYGVMTYLVSQRTKEIGIRMALGATQARVAALVFSSSARLSAIGLAFGAVLALGVLQYIASVVELSMEISELSVYAASLAAIGFVVILAGLGPVRRACRVDPQDALRSD